MRVAVHQPDLLPWSGFWFKMAGCDRFVVARHDQLQKHGYQRRVAMRGSWCSHVLVGRPSLVPIRDVVVAEGWQERLVDVVRGRYSGAVHWRGRGPDLVDRIRACRGTRLDEVNLSLLEVVRDLLGIGTELVTTPPPRARGAERVLEQVLAVGGTTYLAGTGSRAYFGDDAEQRFADAGVRVEWSDHAPVSGDSVTTLLFDHDDPAALVRRRAE